MPDGNTTSDRPEGQPAEPAPATEPTPRPSWPDVTKPETRGRNRGGDEIER